ncbi:MAG: hypothetical protein RBU37_07555 [Myxococcota bacterium]|nr:hypothetical protein [Myxococcota bacterium]
MNKENTFLLMSILIAFAALACSTPQPTPDTEAQTGTPLTKTDNAQLSDGAYVLSVEHEWDRNQEQAFEAELNYVASAGNSYQVVLGNALTEVTVSHPEWESAAKGKRSSSESGKHSYRLSEGLFAGGELVITCTSDGLQAQLDVLGSGVPIISSERGVLTPAQ